MAPLEAVESSANFIAIDQPLQIADNFNELLKCTHFPVTGALWCSADRIPRGEADVPGYFSTEQMPPLPR